jgi:hypothetical protein
MALDHRGDDATLRTPIARGSVIALAAATLFGATAPLVTHFGRGVGPFATAALLYAGATAAAGAPHRRDSEAPVEATWGASRSLLSSGPRSRRRPSRSGCSTPARSPRPCS